MAASCRFAFALHILAVLGQKSASGVTSDTLARSVNTNPVVVRRLLSTLRQAGFVCCTKGSGGGATLCADPSTIRLDAIYRVVEPSCSSFSPHPHAPNKRCPVGSQIKLVLEDVFSSAQHALETALAERTLADVIQAVAAPSASGRLAGKRSGKAA